MQKVNIFGPHFGAKFTASGPKVPRGVNLVWVQHAAKSPVLVPPPLCCRSAMAFSRVGRVWWVFRFHTVDG